MALSPLNTDNKKFPLSDSPFLSRVSGHYESGKNYAMISFNPGFALQAAELNEIQELFFMNINLTQRMNANWIKLNTTQTSPYTAPFWEGLIPLSPDYLTLSNVVYTASANTVSFNYSLSEGWYLFTDANSKLSFWTYNQTNYTSTIDVTSSVYFGTSTSSGHIGCCQTDDSCVDQDQTLRDGSQQSYQEFTCGASRFKININTENKTTLDSYLTLDGAPDSFSHVFLVDLDSTIKTISYPNGYIIQELV